MSEKTLKSILTVLGVLVVLWIGSTLIGGRDTGPNARSGLTDALEGLGPETITSFTVRSPEGASTTLLRAGDRWTANGFAADAEALQRLWGALEDAVVGDVVATNPDNHARMGVGGDNSWSVTFDSDAGSNTVLVGDAGRSFNTGYMRVAGEDEVVLVSGGLRGALTRETSAWRDKTIFAVDTTAAARVRIEREDGEVVVLERGEAGWTFEGAAPRSATIENLIREIERLTASGFKADGVETFTGNRRSIRVEDAEGNVLGSASFFGNETTQHATVEGSDTVFEIPNWRVDRVTPTAALTRPEPSGG